MTKYVADWQERYRRAVATQIWLAKSGAGSFSPERPMPYMSDDEILDYLDKELMGVYEE